MFSNNSNRKELVQAAIAKVKAHLDKHPVDGKTTSDLAQFAGISRNALQKAFKETLGQNIRTYRQTQRMKIATALLQEGKAVKVIARQLGYTSQSAFTTAFKNRFGASPTRWLQQKK